MGRWRSRAASKLRDWILFAVGLAGVAHETLLRDVDRPGLLLMFAAMLGLPYALGADRPQAPSGRAPGSDSSGDDGPSPSGTSPPSPP